MIIQFITMAGGLALFLYGMNMLGVGLEKISGNKMEKLLEKMTDNVLKGILLGVIITAAVQSSSATTVIVVGLVNAGMLKLHSAAGIIMGANIGTTVTGQILRLADLESNENVGFILELIKPTTLAPIITIVGIAMFMLAKNSRSKTIGEVLLGFGILFTGMFAMTDAVKPLSDLPIFAEIFQTLTNPVLGVIAGALITALIQSSSASVGILQALASTGAITCSAAFPIIMGQNIGTCITSLLSSIGANKNARRAAMVHLYFNVIGTIVFLSAVYIYQGVIGFDFWNEAIDMGGIANFHTIFNVVVTVMFIPFVKLLEKLALMTVKDKPTDNDVVVDSKLSLLDERFTVSGALALGQAHTVICTMADYAKKNYEDAIGLFTKYDPKLVTQIEQSEEVIDIMEDKINSYLVELTSKELTEEENVGITHHFKVVSEFERLSDYAINIVEASTQMSKKKMKFSKKANAELNTIASAVNEIIDMTIEVFKTNDLELARKIEPLEEVIDSIVEQLKTKHIERLKNGKCSIECGLIFIEILSNLERISDHCSNTAIYVLMFASKEEVINHHEYINTVHNSNKTEYLFNMQQYKEKYYDAL